MVKVDGDSLSLQFPQHIRRSEPEHLLLYYHLGVGVNDVYDNVNDVDGGVNGNDHRRLLLPQHPQHAWN